MAYRNQQEFINALEQAGELIRIQPFVNPKLEIAEITDRVSKSGNGGKALLFENTGFEFPVLINAYGSERRMCMALGVHDLNDVAKEIENLFHLLSSPKENILDKLKLLPKLGQFASWMPKVKSGRGECQYRVVVNDIFQLCPSILKRLIFMHCKPYAFFVSFGFDDANRFFICKQNIISRSDISLIFSYSDANICT
jgi:4-hydroxy-3-polyprenylbenzoate decarboxylase